jgi:dihydroflavonol-4-reductase
MRVFLTGATGLLGGHLLRQLLQQGFFVSVLIRSDPPQFFDQAIKFCQGDLSDPVKLKEFLKDVDVVIHAAADVSMNVYLNDRQYHTNVTGLKNLIAASKQNNIKRFINVSSAGIFKTGGLINPGTEKEKAEDICVQLPYIKTKLEGEELLQKEFKENGFPFITVNPTFMIGPEDHKPSSGQLILAILKQKIMFYPSGGKNIVDVRDVAQTIIKTIVKGKIGENYILGNENMSYKDFFFLIAQTAHVKIKFLALPDFFMRTGGFFGSILEKLSGSPYQINHITSDMSCAEKYYSSEKAKKELDHHTRPMIQTLNETITWFRKTKRQ